MTRVLASALWLVVLAAVLLSGCGGADEPSESGSGQSGESSEGGSTDGQLGESTDENNASSSGSPSARPKDSTSTENTGEQSAPKPLTHEEIVGYGQTLETAVQEMNVPLTQELLASERLVQVATSSSVVPPSFIESYREKLSGFSDELARSLMAIRENGGSYRLVSYDGTRAMVLMRILDKEANLNYHRMTLVRNADGFAAPVEIVPYASGDPISLTSRRRFLEAAIKEFPEIEAKLSPDDQLLAREGQVHVKATRLIASGQAQSLYDFCLECPESIQSTHFLLQFRMMAAGSIDEKLYDEALSVYEQHHAGSPSLELLLNKQLLEKKKYDECMASVDRLDKLVGDPYLDTIRATIHAAAERYDEAKRAIGRLTTSKDMLLSSKGHMAQLALSLIQMDHALTLETLRVLRDKHEMTFGDFRTIPDYAAFVRSPQFSEWTAENTKQK